MLHVDGHVRQLRVRTSALRPSDPHVIGDRVNAVVSGIPVADVCCAELRKPSFAINNCNALLSATSSGERYSSCISVSTFFAMVQRVSVSADK